MKAMFEDHDGELQYSIQVPGPNSPSDRRRITLLRRQAGPRIRGRGSPPRIQACILVKTI